MSDDKGWNKNQECAFHFSSSLVSGEGEKVCARIVNGLNESGKYWYWKSAKIRYI